MLWSICDAISKADGIFAAPDGIIKSVLGGGMLDQGTGVKTNINAFIWTYVGEMYARNMGE